MKEGLVQVARLGDRSVKIVLAMRSDFLEKFSFYLKLGEIAQNNIYLVTEMYPDELRQAIEQPAAKHGVVFEEGLVEQIIQDVKGQSGYLPLLQYTLDLLWESECHTIGSDSRPQIEDRTLNKASYTALEGVRGALQKRVNQIYKTICDKYKDGEIVTKQIFVRLINIVETGSANKVVSRRAYRDEFVSEPGVKRTLDTFINEKLLVSSCEETNQTKYATVEIAHEILLSSWDTLKSWIEEEKEAIILKNWLADETKRWEKLHQDNQALAREELLKGSRLDRILSLKKNDTFKNVGGLSPKENEFIDASVAWRDRQRNQEKRRNQFIVIAAVVSGIFALLAGYQWQQSELEQIRTLTKSSEALMLLNQTLNARIASLQAARKLEQSIWQVIAPKELKRQVLDGLVQTAYGGDYTIREYNRLESNHTPIECSKHLLASAGKNGHIKIFNFNGTLRKEFPSLSQAVLGVSWSSDGQILASANPAYMVKLWNEGGNLLDELKGHEDDVLSVS